MRSGGLLGGTGLLFLLAAEVAVKQEVVLQGLHTLVEACRALLHVGQALAHLPAHGRIGEQGIDGAAAGLHLALQAGHRAGQGFGNASQLPRGVAQLVAKVLVGEQVAGRAVAPVHALREQVHIVSRGLELICGGGHVAQALAYVSGQLLVVEELPERVAVVELMDNLAQIVGDGH